MSELEELPSWAGRSTGAGQSAETPSAATTAAAAAAAEPQQSALGQQLSQQQQQVHQQVHKPRSRWRVALFALLGVLALVAMGAGGYFLASSQGGSETEAAGGTTDADSSDEGGQLASQELEEEVAPEETDGGETVAADTETEEGAEDAEAEADTVTVDVDDAEEDPAATDEADADTEDTTTDEATAVTEERRAIFKGGKVYLQGAVPSEEIGLAIQEKAAAVVGPDNVVNEYEIDPESVIVPGVGAPLYVEDVVLFEFNSVEVAQPFLPILDLGTLLLRQNPQATVTVVTRTDAIGSEAVNLDVSTKRAQAVINYWLGKGVSPDQIKADPKGEEGASEDDDEQTAALNRRAEFIIAGLLD